MANVGMRLASVLLSALEFFAALHIKVEYTTMPWATLPAGIAQASGLPDLKPQSLAVPSTSSTYYLGQSYTATFSVQNVGAGSNVGRLVGRALPVA